jgi:uncharacterized protein (TIGR00369 family)
MTDLRLDLSPYQRFLGVTCERAGDGEVLIRLPFREEFLRADGSDWLHGGVIAALIDIAGDYAIVTRLGQGVPTIDLRIDWLRPSEARATCWPRARGENGRRVCVADAEVHDATGALVAVGRGLYASPDSEAAMSAPTELLELGRESDVGACTWKCPSGSRNG